MKHLLGLVLALTLVSCAKAQPTLSPAGEAAFKATQVVKALDVLRDVAISAETQTPKLISTADTRKVINFHESAVKTISAVPDGWRNIVAVGLAQLQHDLPQPTWTRIQPYAALVTALIESFPR
jgi:hypothetical protein